MLGAAVSTTGLYANDKLSTRETKQTSWSPSLVHSAGVNGMASAILAATDSELLFAHSTSGFGI